MTGQPEFRRETVDRPINHGDPDTVTQCVNCGLFYRNGEPVNKPGKSWIRAVAENWWRYGWQTDMVLGGTIPIGYGVSWFHYDSMKVAVHPIPFNVVMRWLRDLAFWAMRGGWRQFPSVVDKIDLEVARRLPYDQLNTELADTLMDAIEWNDDYKRINNLAGGDPYWVSRARTAIALSGKRRLDRGNGR